MSRPIELIDKPRIKVVVLALENSHGDILITQRSKHQHLAGYWEFPGGKVEAGETNEQALIRECQEELSYQPHSLHKIHELTHEYPDVIVNLHVFYEQNSQPKVHPAEQQTMQWVAKDQLKQYKFPAANQSILQAILSQ